MDISTLSSFNNFLFVLFLIGLVCEMRINAFVKIAGERCVIRGPHELRERVGRGETAATLTNDSEFIVASPFRRSVRQLISENQVLLPKGGREGQRFIRFLPAGQGDILLSTDEHG